MPAALDDKERQEILFWKNDPDEHPDADSLSPLIDKIRDTSLLLACLDRHDDGFRDAQDILELGAGQGWASCVVKRRYPQATVTATDISPYALASIPKWERVFDTHVDHTYACRSYEIDEPDASLDCIFCFAAAHHFIAHRRTLKEIHRVLRPNGHCYYFYEPSCRKSLHALARWRVNQKRPEVPEDVLIYSKLQALAAEAGLTSTLDFFPSTEKRGGFETLYFSALGALPALQRLLPCTINYRFQK